MKHFVRIRKECSSPQLACIIWQDVQYRPVFLYAINDQDSPARSKRTFSNDMHDYYRIALYTKSQGNNSKERAYCSMNPGVCFLLYPGQQINITSQTEHVVYSEIVFSYESANNKILRISFDKLLSLYAGIAIKQVIKPELSIGKTQMLRDSLLTLTDHLNSRCDFSTYYAHYKLAEMFDFLIRYATNKTKGRLVDDGLDCVRIYVEELYFKRLSMDELARMAGLSKGHFFRVFKESFGISPLAYQQRIRVEAAKTFLKTTRLRCKEIAWRIGFNDEHFFNRIFKTYVGLAD